MNSKTTACIASLFLLIWMLISSAVSEEQISADVIIATQPPCEVANSEFRITDHEGNRVDKIKILRRDDVNVPTAYIPDGSLDNGEYYLERIRAYSGYLLGVVDWVKILPKNQVKTPQVINFNVKKTKLQVFLKKDAGPDENALKLLVFRCKDGQMDPRFYDTLVLLDPNKDGIFGAMGEFDRDWNYLFVPISIDWSIKNEVARLYGVLKREEVEQRRKSAFKESLYHLEQANIRSDHLIWVPIGSSVNDATKSMD